MDYHSLESMASGTNLLQGADASGFAALTRTLCELGNVGQDGQQSPLIQMVIIPEKSSAES